MAFKESDRGVLGDSFEWAVQRAIERQDPLVIEHLLAAIRMRLPRFNATRPLALVVAIERGQFAQVIERAGEGAVIPRAAPGRPPLVTNALRRATRRNWKADLLVGDAGAEMVPVSIKSNRQALVDVSPDDPDLLMPPQIGIAPSRATFGYYATPEISINDRGLPVLGLPANLSATRGLANVLEIVTAGLGRDFTPPRNLDLHDDWAQDLMLFLSTRVGVSMNEILEELADAARLRFRPRQRDTTRLLWQEFDSTLPEEQPNALVIASDALTLGETWS